MEVYDCFMFFNELDLLEFRLNMLNDYVDHFVIVEIPYDYHGEKKPLYFKDNTNRYEKWKDKIIYITDNNIPKPRYLGDPIIQYYQRNLINNGLKNCDFEDIIMISDLDEIIDPNILLNFASKKVHPNRERFIRYAFWALGTYGKGAGKILLKEGTIESFLEITPIAFEQRVFLYFMNYERLDEKGRGTVICKYQNYSMPQQLRNLRDLFPRIRDGGWHFSYMGGIESIKSKLRIITEIPKDMSRAEELLADDEEIMKCIESGIDLFELGQKLQLIRVNEIGIDDIENKMPCLEKYIYNIF